MKKVLNFISKKEVYRPVSLIISLIILFLVATPRLCLLCKQAIQKIKDSKEEHIRYLVEKETRDWSDILENKNITSIEYEVKYLNNEVVTTFDISESVVLYIKWLNNEDDCQKYSEPGEINNISNFDIDFEQFQPSSLKGSPFYCSYYIYKPAYQKFRSEYSQIIDFIEQYKLNHLADRVKIFEKYIY